MKISPIALSTNFTAKKYVNHENRKWIVPDYNKVRPYNYNKNIKEQALPQLLGGYLAAIGLVIASLNPFNTVHSSEISKNQQQITQESSFDNKEGLVKHEETIEKYDDETGILEKTKIIYDENNHILRMEIEYFYEDELIGDGYIERENGNSIIVQNCLEDGNVTKTQKRYFEDTDDGPSLTKLEETLYMDDFNALTFVVEYEKGGKIIKSSSIDLDNDGMPEMKDVLSGEPKILTNKDGELAFSSNYDNKTELEYKEINPENFPELEEIYPYIDSYPEFDGPVVDSPMYDDIEPNTDEFEEVNPFFNELYEV